MEDFLQLNGFVKVVLNKCTMKLPLEYDFKKLSSPIAMSQSFSKGMSPSSISKRSTPRDHTVAGSAW